MARLSREQLLSPGAKTRSVDVPELGGDVLIRRIGVGERDDAVDAAPEGQGSYAVVALAIVDPPDMDISDVRLLQIPVFERISTEVYTFNNFIATDDESGEVSSGEDAAMATFPVGEPGGDEA